eukprot:CAMPEP_0185283668 /NCGR_PEP_ID=MMETSP1363-20130426/620_1 /TAXON_ID=38817 /ORGANISM="Gephyrocapsa oceanica, Strain RCC1303" /LENGTH=47 /DNA_ID= /DNA_START= /DNA_END= /DNA_ORIENTATION=
MIKRAVTGSGGSGGSVDRSTGREMQPAREMKPAERRGDGRAATVGEG